MKLTQMIKESDDSMKYKEVIATIEVNFTLPGDVVADDVLPDAEVIINGEQAQLISTKIITEEKIKGEPTLKESLLNDDPAEEALIEIRNTIEAGPGENLTNDEYVRFCDMLIEYLSTNKEETIGEDDGKW